MRGNKRDRLARLFRVEHLLYQNPQGLTFKEIADLCEVSVRTARRDVAALESQFTVPVWEGKGGLRGINRGHYLPPTRFSFLEAMTIFLASRLLINYSNAYNPSIDSTFVKLNSVVPVPLRDQISKTLAWMRKQKKDEPFLRTMETLANAWIDGQRVKIWYWTLGDDKPKERIIEPYFIQPAALEHANYVIAYCHQTRSVRTFKIERVKNIELLDEHYTIPADFNANEYLGSAWGISVYGEVERVRLKFNPEIARIALETTWHPSQVTEPQPDGSAIVTLSLPITTELVTFVLGWGEKVEVIEPESLRQEVVQTAQAMLKVYRKNSFCDI